MNSKSNYTIPIILAILFILVFGFDILSSVAVGIFFYWVTAIFQRSNECLPIKELFLSLYALQYLFGAALTYNGIDEYTPEVYQMKIDKNEYFLFTIPVFLAFTAGFNQYSKRYHLKVNRSQINDWLIQNKQVPYYFIGIGFIAPFFSQYFPSSLSFVLYLLESFKYVGLFVLLLSYQKIKAGLLFIIYGLILVSSFRGGMFHDLLTWLIVLGLILSYRFKPNWQLKLTAISLFLLFTIFIQTIKGGLREKTWDEGEAANIELIQQVNAQTSAERGGFFSPENLGPQVNRFNQGWILASAINHVPSKEAHTKGQNTLEYIFSALLPRVLAPNKLNAGSRELFNKFSGHTIGEGTSMGLGLFADGYIEFGKFGALVYVFLFGLMYGYILNQFYVRSYKFPILIFFIVLAYIYPMRPDCETQTVLGHLFKTILLLAGIFFFYRKTFAFKTVNPSNN